MRSNNSKVSKEIEATKKGVHKLKEALEFE